MKNIHYDIGKVDVEVNHSHMNKLRILKMQMENWQHNEGASFSIDSPPGRLFEADLNKVNELMEGKPTGNFLTKDEMYELNDLFKHYGGIRKSK